MARKPKRDPFVSRFVDRHGKERFRFRRDGVSIYLPHPATDEYQEAYRAALAGATALQPRCKPRSIDDLLTRYYSSPAFLNSGDDTKRMCRSLLEGFREQFGADMVANFRPIDIEAILVAKAEKRRVGKRTVGGKVAAANLRKQLRRLFRYAVKLEWIGANPVDSAEGVKQDKDAGFHTWSEEEIAQYRARHALGTRARLALEIILWTAQRRGDAHRFGPAHVKGGRVRYVQAKTGKTLWLPAAPQMLAAIDAMPAVGLTTFLVTEFGKPFSKAGFGNKMREWCDQAGLPHCSAHGLRKAAARRAAEMQGTNQQIKALGGWSNDREVALYTAGADQERLAAEIVTRVSEWDGSDDETV